MDIIYYEKSIQDHPRTQSIIKRVGKKAVLIACDSYQEVFNLNSQNFRIQKQNPALILAKKTGNLVLATPKGFGIGGSANYYFSHMLNCLYDCRYCFLQGMYPSAHYVVFVNYEDFAQGIKQILAENKSEPQIYFFSGYDGDSLAFEPVSQFLEFFLPFFAENPRAILELRTKSANVQSLLQKKPLENVIAAFSLTPESISQKLEHKVPPLVKRLQAMSELAKAGWQIGLRLDPLIAADNFSQLYQELISTIFNFIPTDSVHSVSVGALRFPQKIFQKMVKLYPNEALLAQPLSKRNSQFSYSESLENQMKQRVMDYLQKYIHPKLLFQCSPLGVTAEGNSTLLPSSAGIAGTPL
jgi:spore photoproduct lyase